MGKGNEKNTLSLKLVFIILSCNTISIKKMFYFLFFHMPHDALFQNILQKRRKLWKNNTKEKKN